MFYLPQEIQEKLTERYNMQFGESGQLENWFDVIKKPETLKVIFEDSSYLLLSYAEDFYVYLDKIKYVIILTEHCGFFYYNSRMLDAIMAVK